MGMKIAIVLERAEMRGMQAMQNALVVGTPSPTAIAGFGHALARAVGGQHLGSAMVVHSFEVLPGHPKFVPDKDSAAASTVDERSSNGVITLAMLLDVPDDLDLDEDLTPAIRRMTRFAGGVIAGEPRVVTLEPDRLEQHLRSKIGAGWLLVDRTDLMEEGAAAGRDPLDVIIDAMEIVDGERRQKGVVVPLHLGYQALEVPLHRAGTHRRPGENYKHALVEPVTGLGEFVSVRRRLADRRYLWNHGYDSASGLYLVSGTSR